MFQSFVAAAAGDSLGFYAELETTWERVVLSCPCTFTAMPSLTIRLAPDLLTALEATATAQGTTRTALVTAALAQYLQLPPEPLEARLEAIESRLEALESSRKTTAPPQHQSRRTIAPVTQDTMGGDSNTPAGLSQLEALIESGAIPPGTPRGSANGMIRRRFQQSPEDFLEALGWTLHGNGNRRRWRPPEDTTPTG
jgi:predicted transcriptional regulator